MFYKNKSSEIITHLRLKGYSSVITLFTIMGLIVNFSCQKEDNYDKELNEIIGSLTPISDAFPAEKDAVIDSTAEEQDSEYIYKIDYYSASAGFDEQIVLNPQTDVIFPGALIKGESVLDGSYVLIPAKRKPITLSTSLSGSGFVSIEIPDPKLSTVRSAINTLMQQEYDVPPANMGFTIDQAYSSQQLTLSLRASYSSGIVDVSGGFDYSKKNIKTRLVAKFIQNYYTLDMDMPASAADLFEGDVNETLFGTYMPMYIASVTYGRMALFTIESELEETEVRGFLQGSYMNVDAASSTDFESLKAKSTMKVYILGGSGSDAGQTIDGFESFKNYIKAGGNFSKESPGAPISYKLRYIMDNTIGKIVFSASYPIRTAIPRTDNLLFNVKTSLYSFKTDIVDAGSECELFGNIISYCKRIGAASNHDHFSSLVMGSKTSFNFPDNTTTSRMFEDLLIEDTIRIYIDIYEDDLSGDEYFTKSTFEIPLIDIAAVLGTGVGYYETGDLKVMYGSESVIARFRFYPTMRHIPDP